ncbi:MAG: hypothetical protein JXR96_28515 [Deltaproteobacteria bacterium]|nr:hypothetical protein [Deltaproteobacteria bacterium]
MRRSFRIVVLGMCTLLLLACGSSSPRIEMDDVNVRNLCNIGVNGESEDRCDLAAPECPGSLFCWDPQDEQLVQGFCRECMDDNNCEAGEECDHGWCHATCSQHGDCGTNEMCVGGLCRHPYTTEFSFSNSGSGDLEIYKSQTTLKGESDACAYTEVVWSIGGDPVVLGTDESVMLRIYFLPPDVGMFRAVINIYSNDDALSPLPLLLCGESVEAKCMPSSEEDCAPCTAACTEENFTPILDSDPGCALNHGSAS